MTSSGITVVVCTVGPPRRGMLRRAMESIYAQTLQPDAIVIAQDNSRLGAPFTRQAGTDCVQTPLVAFLDDDDVLKPQHLELLAQHQFKTDADLVYGWYDVVGGTDPFPQWEGVPWSDNQIHQVPVTYLARTDAIHAAGGWLTDWDANTADDPGTDTDGNRAGEDLQLIKRLVASGAKIVHLPIRTWNWSHNSGNTMGLPSRVNWDSVG